MRAARALLAAALAAPAACLTRDTVATAAGGDRQAFCLATGPPVLADGTCTGELAAASFRQAACACGALDLGGNLGSDGFDSRAAPWAPGGTGGAVAGNAGGSFAGAVDVGGDLTVSGGNGLEAGPTLRVLGDLAVGGALGRPSSAISVAGAASVGGGIQVTSLGVAGTLTTPAGAVQTGAIAAGALATAPVVVAAPCPCPPADSVDVAAIVGQHRLANHDDSIGLAPDALADVGGGATLELPCGRFYLTRIQATGGGTITLRATGRTALFIEGNVTVDGPLVVALGDGADVDLFVSGVLNLPGGARLGDPARPRALRIWVASAGAVNLSGDSLLAGNLYAPAADLTSSGPLEVFGAVLVGHLAVSAGFTVHYDRAVAAAAQACGP